MKKKLIIFIKSKDKTYLIKKNLIKIYQNIVYKRLFQHFGRNSYLIKPSKIVGKQYISIGSNTVVLDHSRIEAIDSFNSVAYKPIIKIGNNIRIGQNFHLTSINQICLENDITISGNVLITDHDHDYKEINKHIMEQPLIQSEVNIGESSFIGFGAVILAGTKLGKHCIVGANSVVRGVFDDYSVIVGSPAKVVKKYDSKNNEWKNC